MKKLSDTQLTILSAAARRTDGNLLPLPGSLRGGAAVKVVGALLSRGLIRETIIDGKSKADSALNTIWRNREDGRGVLLLITAAGLEALGIEAGDEDVGVASPESGSAPGAADESVLGKTGPHPAVAPEAVPTARPVTRVGKAREGTKQAALIAMLHRPEGATIAEIVAVTKWQSHTIRGAFAGALKKRLGLVVTSAKVEGRGRVYRLS
jgi:hypothetical protein